MHPINIMPLTPENTGSYITFRQIKALKFFLVLLFTGLCIAAIAQKTESFYDYNWKASTPENARFYSTVEKTDSGWLRNDYFINGVSLQMRALYEDKDCKIQNGQYYYYHANGYASSLGRMVKSKQEGVCMRYHSNGMTADSAFYKNGRPTGYRLIWHRNGFLSDSIAHINDSIDVQIGWFDDGAPSSGGYLLRGKKHGKWIYYHHTGVSSGTEVYSNGDLVSKEYFNEDGTPQPDIAKTNTDATFKNGTQAWTNYLEKKLYWPPGYKITNANMVTVGVQFVIDEAGKPQDVEIVVPFKTEFDKIAVNIIRNCPEWKPAIRQNRKVKMLFRQAVTFQQDE
jgi:antitoxin component YwqK of YwqJK toxin-antitoxin module